ncbi:hypothetical protein GWK47_051457 [Chionoecetes opilio]|uniref:Uncharacterized protein n=1 Tax=Chionoecetes opilio TaxID=41210 RepID=A0A8J4Y0S2_CHIOP|nr:hypothetical protein GWK47_051457 [Chionoecetes opilio]
MLTVEEDMKVSSAPPSTRGLRNKDLPVRGFAALVVQASPGPSRSFPPVPHGWLEWMNSVNVFMPGPVLRLGDVTGRPLLRPSRRGLLLRLRASRTTTRGMVLGQVPSFYPRGYICCYALTSSPGSYTPTQLYRPRLYRGKSVFTLQQPLQKKSLLLQPAFRVRASGRSLYHGLKTSLSRVCPLCTLQERAPPAPTLSSSWPGPPPTPHPRCLASLLVFASDTTRLSARLNCAKQHGTAQCPAAQRTCNAYSHQGHFPRTEKCPANKAQCALPSLLRTTTHVERGQQKDRHTY